MVDHTHGGAVDQSMATLQPPHDLIGVQGVQFLDLEVGVGLRVRGVLVVVVSFVDVGMVGW